MCGISGYYSPQEFFREEDLRKMVQIQQHRGPDAQGHFHEGSVGLGHNRLSILDLSSAANQPMHSHDGRYVLVYNGEIYNYREIASELRLKFNSSFKTSSDTEVVLESYIQYGEKCLEKFNGMFALAIYDREEKSLFLARDRVGIKPLYYYWDGKNFAFASELKALKALPSIPHDLNNNAIYKFLHLGFIPAPMSIYKSIRKMESGTWFRIQENQMEEKTYWSVFEKITPRIVEDEKEAIVRLSDLIMSSVQYQIKSDVPFGIFLSGGIDSSLISSCAVSLAGVKINTFSIGFEEDRYNESAYAKSVASYLGANHTEFVISYKEATALIDEMMDTYSEPFGDSSAIPCMLVSQLARQKVTVTLSGEGGDELFMGYGAYPWARRLNHPLVKLGHRQIKNLLEYFPWKFERHGKYFDRRFPNMLYSHILSQEQYIFSMGELDGFLTPTFKNSPGALNTDSLINFDIRVKNLSRRLGPEERQAIFDLQFYLQYDLLTKVDRASMHYSLETRVPFLDHRLIEYSLNLSPKLKIRNNISKYVLKEILYQYVPKTFFNRPKQGFAIPLENWLKKELYFLIEEDLSKEKIEKYNIVKFSEIERIKKEFIDGKNYLYNRIWHLIVLHRWLSMN